MCVRTVHHLKFLHPFVHPEVEQRAPGAVVGGQVEIEEVAQNREEGRKRAGPLFVGGHGQPRHVVAGEQPATSLVDRWLFPTPGSPSISTTPPGPLTTPSMMLGRGGRAPRVDRPGGRIRSCRCRPDGPPDGRRRAVRRAPSPRWARGPRMIRRRREDRRTSVATRISPWLALVIKRAARFTASPSTPYVRRLGPP